MRKRRTGLHKNVASIFSGAHIPEELRTSQSIVSEEPDIAGIAELHVKALDDLPPGMKGLSDSEHVVIEASEAKQPQISSSPGFFSQVFKSIGSLFSGRKARKAAKRPLLLMDLDRS